MATEFSVIPKGLLMDLMAPQAPRNVDEFIMAKARHNMQQLSRSKKAQGAALQRQNATYQANLKNLIKTKREVESRPLRVSVANLGQMANKTRKRSYNDVFDSDDEYADAETTLNASRKGSSLNSVRDPNNISVQMADDEDDTAEPQIFATQNLAEPPIKLKSPVKSPAKTPPKKNSPPKKASTSKTPDSEKKKRALSTRVFATSKKEELVDKVLELISKNEAKYLVKDNKIYKDAKNYYTTSNVQHAVDAIVSESINADHTGVGGSGYKLLQQRLVNDPAYTKLVTQFGKGKVGKGKQQSGAGRKPKPKNPPKKKENFRAERWQKRPRKL